MTENDALDTGPMGDYHEYWAVIVDNDYQGLQKDILDFHSTMKPKENSLYSSEKQ